MKELTPFEKGYRAYGERKGVSDNPYPKPDVDHYGVSPYWQWYAGWSKADREDND